MFADKRATAMLPAKDLERAKRFYTDVLGLKPVEEMEQGAGASFVLGGGTRVFLYPTQFAGTAQHTLLSFDTKDLAADMKALRGKGVKFEEYDLPNLKTVDGVARWGEVKNAWFKDSEGNYIWQPASAAGALPLLLGYPVQEIEDMPDVAAGAAPVAFGDFAKGYLIVDGTDGKAHYVALPPRSELEQYPTGAVVEVKGAADVRAADRDIAALAVDGVYRADHHLAVAQGQATSDRDPREVVAAHVRRLEALRRAGIVEREAEGVWRVPADLADQGRQYDAQRLGGGVVVELKSHLPIERQARVIGATWLDQQLIGGGRGLGDLGFGCEVKDALRQRADFLAEQGLAEHRGQRVVLARNLLATLRGRELAQAAKDIATETGLEHRPVAEGQRVVGIYRRSVMLASGRYAMLDDGMGFSLVPWRPVIEQRLGQQLAATVQGVRVLWEIGRTRTQGV